MHTKLISTFSLQYVIRTMTRYDSTLVGHENKIFESYLLYSLLPVTLKTYTRIMSYGHFGQYRCVFHFVFKFHCVMKISEIVLHVV
jgi:hypothetical protein